MDRARSHTCSSLSSGEGSSIDVGRGGLSKCLRIGGSKGILVRRCSPQEICQSNPFYVKLMNLAYSVARRLTSDQARIEARMEEKAHPGCKPGQWLLQTPGQGKEQIKSR